MTIRTVMPDHNSGHDATHRGKIRSTHPTHPCSEHFRRFASGRIASSELRQPQISAFEAFPERAKRAPRSWPC